MATNGKFVAYYRVSTAKQGASGLGLEAQQEAVRVYLNGGRWKMVAEFTEVESGKRDDRPKLAEALALCRLYNATLIIAKIDRLARNVNFISNLMESSVEFVAVDFPKANRLTVHILAAVAEHEALAISARTRAALAAAKAKGTKLGGKRHGFNIGKVSAGGVDASIAMRRARAKKRATDLVPVIRSLQAEGYESLRAVAAVLNERGILTARDAALNDRGIETARGGEWTAVQVQRVLTQGVHKYL